MTSRDQDKTAFKIRLLTTIDEIEKDINMRLVDIKKVAKDIDDKIGLGHR